LVKCDSYFLNNLDKSISFAVEEDEKLAFIDLKRQKQPNNLASRLKNLCRKKSAREPLLISKKGYALYFRNPSIKKTNVNSETYGLRIDLLYTPKSFFLLSGNFEQIDKNLK